METSLVRVPLADRRESKLWHQTYACDAETRRRLRAFPRKLRLLGLDQASRDAAVLDLCCGHAEALCCLNEMGFSDLCGVDLQIDEDLASDHRFQVHCGDALHTPYPDARFDWVLNIHSMHHFATVENVRQFLRESWRLLKPGGRLGIVDFPASPQIRLAFWFFRQNRFLWTPYLKRFARLLQEEWHFLKDYLPEWHKVRALLLDGPFEVERRTRRLFYSYLTLRKPLCPHRSPGLPADFC